MIEDLVNDIRKYFHQRDIPIISAASAEAYNNKAPEGFRPEEMLPGAKTIVIMAKPLPLSVFLAPKNNMIYSFYTSAYSSYYGIMNSAASTACLMMQDAGFPSLPIPSYSPLKFHEGEPRGLISLKHSAVAAGLGKMGKNTLLIHPEHGNILRLGGLLTTMEWPLDEPDEAQEYQKLCPEKCTNCIDACPVQALSHDGIDKTKCMGHCIKHTLMPPQWFLPYLRWGVKKSRFMTNLMELFTLSFFESYGVGCFECLRKCPHFPSVPRKTFPF